jgi:hypothetical protein
MCESTWALSSKGVSLRLDLLAACLLLEFEWLVLDELVELLTERLAVEVCCLDGDESNWSDWMQRPELRSNDLPSFDFENIREKFY